ncbi:hypothetical protein OC846_003840 [Tilletia horrida]|uniref:Uncharacterized protein n=1 Tax=Tilletia horrida TaxID=155126 RepID=A0AAN6GNN8_9BASI|nr:hypothetical protein OC846_003840 [Tilletia horrida]
MPISDDGGSSSEIIRVLAYRLPTQGSMRAIKEEWLDILEGRHRLWKGIEPERRECIRGFLVHFESEILRRAHRNFNFRGGSIGNFFLAAAQKFFRSVSSAIFLFSALTLTSSYRGSRVIPAINTNHTATIAASLLDGDVLVGQCEISHPSKPRRAPAPPPSRAFDRQGTIRDASEAAADAAVAVASLQITSPVFDSPRSIDHSFDAFAMSRTGSGTQTGGSGSGRHIPGTPSSAIFDPFSSAGAVGTPPTPSDVGNDGQEFPLMSSSRSRSVDPGQRWGSAREGAPFSMAQHSFPSHGEYGGNSSGGGGGRSIDSMYAHQSDFRTASTTSIVGNAGDGLDPEQQDSDEDEDIRIGAAGADADATATMSGSTGSVKQRRKGPSGAARRKKNQSGSSTASLIATAVRNRRRRHAEDPNETDQTATEGERTDEEQHERHSPSGSKRGGHGAREEDDEDDEHDGGEDEDDDLEDEEHESDRDHGDEHFREAVGNILFAKDQGGQALNQPLSAPIERVFYVNAYRSEIFPRPSSEYLSVLGTAQTLLYSCGSLWTSIIPCLALRNVGSAIALSPTLTHKILLLNTTHDRETNGMDAIGFLRAITDTLNRCDVPPTTNYSSTRTASGRRRPTRPSRFAPRNFVTHLVFFPTGEIRVDQPAIERLGIRCVPVQGSEADPKPKFTETSEYAIETQMR